MPHVTPSPAAREAAWANEARRKEAAAPIITHYEKGLLTFDELIAGLASVRLDEHQWAHPGSTYPEHTIASFARLLIIETTGQEG